MLIANFVMGGVIFLFFLFLPILSGGINYRKWRDFRSTLKEVYSLPPFQEQEEEDVRLFGRIDSFLGDNRISLRCCSKSITVNMTESSLYLLEEDGLGGGGTLEPLMWKRMTSLVEGTPLLVAGRLSLRDGQWFMEPLPGKKVFVMMGSDDEDVLMKSGMLLGRRRNHYWNGVTPWSLLAGALILLIHAYALPSQPLLVFRNVFAAMLPINLFLPPGVLFYFLYRDLRDSALQRRAERDLEELVTGTTPSGQGGAPLTTAAAAAALAGGFVVNLPVLSLLTRFLVL